MQKTFKEVGHWLNNSEIELVELVNGNTYALNGWNGETYEECWKCLGEFLTESSDEKYRIRPVYRFQIDSTFANVNEGDDRWEEAVETIDYDIMY